jgi:hypothetical protein
VGIPGFNTTTGVYIYPGSIPDLEVGSENQWDQQVNLLQLIELTKYRYLAQLVLQTPSCTTHKARRLKTCSGHSFCRCVASGHTVHQDKAGLSTFSLAAGVEEIYQSLISNLVV